jgi:hypothetical protein
VHRIHSLIVPLVKSFATFASRWAFREGVNYTLAAADVAPMVMASPNTVPASASAAAAAAAAASSLGVDANRAAVVEDGRSSKVAVVKMPTPPSTPLVTPPRPNMRTSARVNDAQQLAAAVSESLKQAAIDGEVVVTAKSEAAHDRRVRTALKEAKRELVTVPSDGDCVFASVIKGCAAIGFDFTLGESSLKHVTPSRLRECLAQWISGNKHELYAASTGSDSWRGELNEETGQPMTLDECLGLLGDAEQRRFSIPWGSTESGAPATNLGDYVPHLLAVALGIRLVLWMSIGNSVVVGKSDSSHEVVLVQTVQRDHWNVALPITARTDADVDADEDEDEDDDEVKFISKSTGVRSTKSAAAAAAPKSAAPGNRKRKASSSSSPAAAASSVTLPEAESAGGALYPCGKLVCESTTPGHEPCCIIGMCKVSGGFRYKLHYKVSPHTDESVHTDECIPCVCVLSRLTPPSRSLLCVRARSGFHAGSIRARDR